MKRFMVFDFDNYYPGGGWNDFVGSSDDLDEAKTLLGGADFRQIVDSITGLVVFER